MLKCLLMFERDIVSDIPGTTRDTVEEMMEIGGIPIHLVDTAGLRSTGDHVEMLGVARSEQAMEQADLVLVVIDLSAPWDEADRRLVNGLDPARSIVVGNKTDLVENGQALLEDFGAYVAGEEQENLAGEWKSAAGDSRWLRSGEQGRRLCVVSAKTGEGLRIRLLIQQVVTAGTSSIPRSDLGAERTTGAGGEASKRAASALAGGADKSKRSCVRGY